MAEMEIWSVRLDKKTATRIRRVAKALSKQVAGVEVTRSRAARLAVERGIDALEDELDISRRKK